MLLALQATKRVAAAAAACIALLAVVEAAPTTRNYDFNITWTTANPDGAFDRPTIGINGQWPLPPIVADVGDNVVVRVTNQLGNQSTSLHFHGLFMNGSTHMDGPSGVSQCEIVPGVSFTYNFTIKQHGTYWYHSHTHAQYPDGLRGPLIIHDPKSPFLDMYDEEVVLTVSDWYHDQMADLLPGFISKSNPTGAEPVPDAVLLNDTQALQVAVQPGRTYLVRMINMGAFAGQYVWFEGHNMSIVEVDGVYTEPAVADSIYLSAAQRCSFLLTTKNETTENFAFVASMDTTLFDTLPDDLNYNATGWLVYDEAHSLPEAAIIDGDFDPFDDMTLVPFDKQARLPPPNRTIELDVIMDNLGDGANYAFFNNITYVAPKVPSLYTALSANSSDNNDDPAIYGSYTNAFVLAQGEVVQIVVNNLDSGRHPFHLHGHHFQALYRSDEEAGTFNAADAAANVSEEDFPETPMRRDTFVLYPDGNVVLRFRADNPGVWLFHCHIEWHVASGLIATFVEAPAALRRQYSADHHQLPADHRAACAAAGIPMQGNAAGNARDFLDLTGENRAPDPLPEGFTTRGKVALAFSCLSGILGVAVVAWYGLVPEPGAQSAAPKQRSGAVSTNGGRAGGEPSAAAPAGVDSKPELITSISGGGSTATTG